MKLIKPFIITGLFFLITVLTPATVPAIPMAEILYVESELDNGIWQYEYMVFNTSDPLAYPGVDLYDVLYWFDPLIALLNVSVPNEWDAIYDNVYIPGELLTFSLEIGAHPAGADIAPGKSLGGFVFQFDGRAGNLEFEVLFTNPSDLENPLTYSGNTAPVPEPATLLLLAAGLGGLGLVRRRRVTARRAKGCA